jgi:hypothetical protein
MNNLLHKLCEKSEAELWEMVKVEQWTPEHAKVAFYLTEIMKGVKKIEHLKLVQEAMDRAEEMGEEGMEHMLGKEQNMHHYARRGGRMSGRGRNPMMSRYAMYDYDEGEGEGYPHEKEWEHNWKVPPTMYEMKQDEKYWEKKYKELWEEKEKEKKENAGNRILPPPPPK